MEHTFKRGDTVELCGSDGIPCGTMKVVRAGPRVVRTDCGRRYRQGDGNWIDSDGRVWPFPWIQPNGFKAAVADTINEGEGR